MAKTPRVSNNALLAAGLELMRQNGRPLEELPSSGRSMLYALPNGETVRVRTSNDHILIVLADKPSPDAKLNIEGTDWLLVVMPEVPRTPGNVLAYLVRADEAANTARREFQNWLDSGPNTKGTNTTWNLWFRGDGRPNDFATNWRPHRLKGVASTEGPGGSEAGSVSATGDIKAEVEAARQRIAKVAGISANAVRITLDFTT
jgi:hypothetical protein